jgi:hypothetical protein
LIGPLGDHGHIGQKSADPGRRDDVVQLTKGKRVTGGDRTSLSDQLKKKYEGGASIRALAEETGRSYGFVHRILSESGATLRGRGGATRKKKV